MRIAIAHDIAVSMPPGLVRTQVHLLMQPQAGQGQTIADWTVECDGMAGAARFTDGYGNAAALVTQPRPEDVVTVKVRGIVETRDTHGVVGRVAGGPVPALFRRVTPLTRSNVTVFGKFRSSPRDGRDRIALLHALMERIGEFHVFSPDGSVPEDPAPAAQSQSQSLGTMTQSQSQGGEDRRTPATARDFAHAFIGAARALDIPARYVTGYALDIDAPFHAWAEAWDDGLGWIGFDAALGLCPTDRHVRLAVGLDALSAQPLRASPTDGQPETTAISVTEA